MRTRAADDRGSVLIIVTLALVAMLTMVAIVIDISQLRQDRQSNKRLTDAAAAAAALDLQVGPWQAVCTAYDYTLANAQGFSTFDTESWSDQATTPTTYAAAPGSCPTGVSYNAPCTSDPTTWADFHGTAQGGNIIIDIKSGYVMPDPTFSQDAAITGDDGQPCDQVAVIESQRRPAVFGKVVGTTSQETTTRSVARISRGFSQVAALVVLEQADCRAIDASTNGGELVVNAVGDTPGAISVDSDGSGSCSGSQTVVQGSALPGGGPNIIAKPTTPGTGTPKTGRISIFALGTNPTIASTQTCPYSATPPASCTVMPTPTRSVRLGRTYLDQRYLDGVRAHVQTGLDAINSAGGVALSTIAGISKSNGANPTCTVTGTVTIPITPVFIDCGLSVQSGSTLEFTASNPQIVAQSTISVGGSSGGQGPGSFIVDQPGALYVAGSTQGASPVAINVTGNFRLGDGGTGACPTPTSGNPTGVVVVRDGQLSVGGGATSVLRMCQTAVLMASGYSSGSSPPAGWPTTAGAAPYNNSFTGLVSIGGQGSVTWTAPNAVPSGPATQSDWTGHLEDLTLWTETSAGSSIAGQGGVSLAGVLALPNSDPFTISGTGSQTISANAQFWTRKLTLSGQAILQMAPNPDDSIPVTDFSLVR